jgi:hypothetical protein
MSDFAGTMVTQKMIETSERLRDVRVTTFIDDVQLFPSMGMKVRAGRLANAAEIAVWQEDGVWILRTTRHWLPRDLEVLKPLFDRMRTEGANFLLAFMVIGFVMSAAAMLYVVQSARDDSDTVWFIKAYIAVFNPVILLLAWRLLRRIASGKVVD